MKKIGIIILFLCICVIIFIYENRTYNFNQKKIDFFNEILEATDSKTQEFGLKVTFETNEDGQTVCNDLLKTLEMKDDSKINVFKQGSDYCIQFDHDDISGYIESIENDKKSNVVINIVKKGDINGLDELRKTVEKADLGNNKNTKCFQYLKAKVPNSNLTEINSKVVKLLEKDSVKNIETEAIDNGYSTVAYTKQYEAMKYKNNYIDINYSVCKYASGNYLIIGTPIITATY